MTPIENQKRAAAEAAVAEVVSGMLVGLGTGTTAAYAIAALGARVRGGLAARATATSLATAESARAAGIAVLDMSDVARLDLAIDGVDQIDPELRAIKGAGGAMLREKIVARAATRMIAIADGSKRVARLGGAPVPVEVLPFARASVERALAALGAEPVLRMRGDAPWVTDQGNAVFDCHFATLDALEDLATALSGIAGALGHGLFLGEIDTAYVADAEGVRRFERG